MYEIRKGFTNYKGEYFDNIRDINFTKDSDGYFKFGTFISDTVSSKEKAKFYSDGIIYKLFCWFIFMPPKNVWTHTHVLC